MSVDLAPTLAAKSDQQNAVDYMTGPRTITITKVGGPGGKANQPIWIYFTGDDGKPWKPCLTMRRLIVAHWGPKGDDYIGRRLTLYRDPRVDFGEDKGCGGIRISHMSQPKTEDPIVLPTGKNKRAAFRVQRLDDAATEKPPAEPTKPRGDIASALSTIEKWSGDMAPLKKGLGEKQWEKDERAQIKAALDALEKRQVEARTVDAGERQ